MGKITYRIRNWKQYNRALINRGNLTLWISEDAIQSWYAKNDHERGQGRQFTYSDACIELALTLRSLFRFPLRATQSFLEGLVQLMNLKLKVPHYSRLSRRASTLSIVLPRKEKTGPLDLVIDSTGLKVYGEGEWKMRTHGKQKRRVWRKYHVAIDPSTHEVVAQELTQSNTHDCNWVGTLLKNQHNVGKVYADGAYTHPQCFNAISDVGGTPVIPVRTGTCIARGEITPGLKLRNQLIRDERAVGGKTAWKKSSGYHRRSLVETHMFRLKTILGEKLQSRNLSNQKTEAAIMASILNKMTALGMPQSFVK
jgi:IS5 family transposase